MSLSQSRRVKSSPPPFPEQLIEPLFLKGLRHRQTGIDMRPGDPMWFSRVYDVCGFLYLLPLAFGAVRPSEPLHVFTTDVTYDFEHGTGAIVRLYDPRCGRPEEHGWVDREAYLQGRFGIKPRSDVAGQQRSGFKKLLLNERDAAGHKCTRVYWIAPEIGHLYWWVYRAYMDHVQPAKCRHPFLHCSRGGAAFGAPWTLDASGDRFRRGLAAIDQKQSSADGTCLSAFRHRVRRWMDVMGVPPGIQQIVLHHRSIHSQAAYGRGSGFEVSTVLSALSSGQSSREATRLHEIGRELADAVMGIPG